MATHADMTTQEFERIVTDWIATARHPETKRPYTEMIYQPMHELLACDLQMLQWTTAGEGPRFGLIVHHTDAEREWAYDRQSSIGHLDKALDEAAQRGWTSSA